MIQIGRFLPGGIGLSSRLVEEAWQMFTWPRFDPRRGRSGGEGPEDQLPDGPDLAMAFPT